MKKVTLLYLGSTGAGPVYSLEMARAITSMKACEVQIIISKRVSNLDEWINSFHTSKDKLCVVETYGHRLYDFALGLFKFWRVNKIIHLIQNFKPDYLYVPFLLSWDFLIYPRLYEKTKIIATLHDPHPHDKILNPFSKWLHHKNKNAYKYVSEVIILNNKDISYVKENFCKNVAVIPHASFSYYTKEIQESFQLKNTIGFFGRIEPYKGLDLLLDAFQKLDEKYHLLIAGNGKVDRITYQKIVLNKRIEFINRYIEDDEITALLNKTDFVVLPYKRASQSGVIPLAFAHGKPVVVTNVGSLTEQVPEGTGLVTEVDSELLAQTISTFYSNSHRIFEYGKNAKRYADTELSWEHSAKLFMDIIDKPLLDKK